MEGHFVSEIGTTMPPFFDRAEPNERNQFQGCSADLILNSYRRLLGRDLLPAIDATESLAHRLYRAPFVVLAHDTEDDPVFFYGNRAAQALFEFSWSELVALPSRFSAEPVARADRQRLLDQVTRNGFIADYAGIRISRTGKRFQVSNAIVWNLVDETGTKLGQAATFSQWDRIGSAATCGIGP